jgi:hypothetical protein
MPSKIKIQILMGKFWNPALIHSISCRIFYGKSMGFYGDNLKSYVKQENNW